jgi:hypothetical protein
MRAEGCPNDLELEQVLLGESLRAAEHAQGCQKCAPRLAEMRALGDRFSASVYPKLREAVAEAAARPRFGPLRWLVPVLVPVSVALVAFVAWPRHPPGDYVGLKGGAGALLEVYVGEGNQGRQLASGARVHVGDGLRFVVVSPSQRAFVFTVDAMGGISRLYPTAGEAPAPVSGLLPGGAILDEVTGPERVFAVFPSSVVTFSQVEAAVTATYGTVEAVRGVERLPLEVPQQSVLLEKVPR